MTIHNSPCAREQHGNALSFDRLDSGLSARFEQGEIDVIFDRREIRRRQDLAAAGGFLLKHQLDVDPDTLAVANDLLCQAGLASAKTGEGLGNSSTAIKDDLAALMDKFDRSLDEFAKATSTASPAGPAIIQELAGADAVIADLVTIAKVMLERTRAAEQSMSRGAAQTRALQSSLADARRAADIDHLTGLPNRRAFEIVLAKEQAIAAASGEPLCIAFVDLDHFKKINDRYGHVAGDRVLTFVAQSLAKISDARCHVARHGGEEFVILFRGKTPQQAWAVLDAARATLSTCKLIHGGKEVPSGMVTFSGGIAELFSFGSASKALKAADQALYQVKASGRNRIALAIPHRAKSAAA